MKENTTKYEEKKYWVEKLRRMRKRENERNNKISMTNLTKKLVEKTKLGRNGDGSSGGKSRS
jgi:hypothetical protein